MIRVRTLTLALGSSVERAAATGFAVEPIPDMAYRMRRAEALLRCARIEPVAFVLGLRAYLSWLAMRYVNEGAPIQVELSVSSRDGAVLSFLGLPVHLDAAGDEDDVRALGGSGALYAACVARVGPRC